MSSSLLRFPQDGAWDPDKNTKKDLVFKSLPETWAAYQAGRTGLQTGGFWEFLAWENSLI